MHVVCTVCSNLGLPYTTFEHSGELLLHHTKEISAETVIKAFSRYIFFRTYLNSSLEVLQAPCKSSRLLAFSMYETRLREEHLVCAWELEHLF